MENIVAENESNGVNYVTLNIVYSDMYNIISSLLHHHPGHFMLCDNIFQNKTT